MYAYLPTHVSFITESESVREWTTGEECTCVGYHAVIVHASSPIEGDTYYYFCNKIDRTTHLSQVCTL